MFQYLFAVFNSLQVTVILLLKPWTKSKSGLGVGGEGGGGCRLGGGEGECNGKSTLHDVISKPFVSIYFTGETVPIIGNGTPFTFSLRRSEGRFV